jgi:hypothetical protein
MMLRPIPIGRFVFVRETISPVYGFKLGIPDKYSDYGKVTAFDVLRQIENFSNLRTSGFLKYSVILRGD